MAENVVEMFEERVRKSNDITALRYKKGGRWIARSWSDWKTTAEEVAGGLMALGIEPGERVAVLANTRIEWFYSDIGIMMSGAVVIPIYQSNTPDQCEYIINNSGSRVIIAEDAAQLEKLQAERDKLGDVIKVIYMEADATLAKKDKQGRTRILFKDVVSDGDDWFLSWSDFLESGRRVRKERPDDLESRKKSLKKDDPATFVYTSGTTGPPKGVVLTQDALVFTSHAALDAMPIGEDDEQLLFLPLAHIFARILEMACITTGAKTAFAESIPKLVDNLSEVRPTFMGSVPRIYEKVYNGVIANAQKSGGNKLKIFNWAIAVGTEVSKLKQQGKEPGMILAAQHALADYLVFSKLKDRFGGRVRFFVSGGAPLARKIAEFLHAADILVLEGYGLTETSALTCINRADAFKFGTVGKPARGVEVSLADDGEILVRGRSVMTEYYKRDDATKEVFSEDGWFKTGDIGEFDAEGFLSITDRKKDLIKTAGGKYVAPQEVENRLKTSTGLVSQVMVHGDQRPYCTAIITVDEEAVKKWASDHGVSGDYAALTQSPELARVIEAAVKETNSGLTSVEQVKKFWIAPKDFTQEDGEMTPTLKVKRKFVTKKYQAELDDMYGADTSTI